MCTLHRIDSLIDLFVSGLLRWNDNTSHRTDIYTGLKLSQETAFAIKILLTSSASILDSHSYLHCFSLELPLSQAAL